MKLIDVGAFNGDSVLHFVAYPEVTEIEAYEPNTLYRPIWGAIETFYPEVRFVGCAVSDHSGVAQYNRRPANLPLGSTITQDKRDFVSGEKIEVKTRDIAEIVTDKCWLKLDAEGEEFKILERLIKTDKLKLIDRVYLEWHTSKLHGDYQPRQDAIYKELDKAEVTIRNW